MKKFRAYVKLDDEIPTEMIISEKDEGSARKKLTDFFIRLDKNLKIQIELKEVSFDGNNYIEVEE